MSNDKKVIIAGRELTLEQLFMMVIMAMVVMAVVMAVISAIVSLSGYSSLLNNRSVLHLMMLGYFAPFAIAALPSLCFLLFGCFKECTLSLVVGVMASIVFGTIFSLINIIFDSYNMTDSLPLVDKFGIASVAFLALGSLVGLCCLGFYLNKNKQYEKIDNIEMDVIKQAIENSKIDDLSLDLSLTDEESDFEEKCADVTEHLLREVSVDVHCVSDVESVTEQVCDSKVDKESEESEHKEECTNVTTLLRKIQTKSHSSQCRVMEGV